MPSNSIKGLNNFKIDQSNFKYKFGTPLRDNCPFGLYSPLAESMIAAFEVPEIVACKICKQSRKSKTLKIFKFHNEFNSMNSCFTFNYA